MNTCMQGSDGQDARALAFQTKEACNQGGLHEANQAKRAILVAAALACGAMGSVGWSESSDLSLWFRGGVTISASTADAGEASAPVRHVAE